MRRPLLLLLVALPPALAPSEGQACSASACIDGYFYPAPGQSVPGNAPALVLRPHGERFSGTAEEVQVELRGSGIEPRALFAAPSGEGWPVVHVDLPRDLPPGEYEVTANSLCGFDERPTQSQFTLTGPQPFPAELGALAATDVRRGGITVEATGGTCAVSVPSVSIPIEVLLSPEAEPWSDLLLFRTLVDGAIWRPRQFLPHELPVGGSWRGRGRDEIYAECGPLPDGAANFGLVEGTHTVVMQATLPGTSLLLETPSIVVDLRCTPTAPPPQDPAADPSNEGGLASSPLEAGGCACSAREAPITATPWGLLGLLGWIAWRRGRA